MSSEETHNIYDMVETERSISISIDTLSKGIDNYHIDVRLSKKFTSEVKKLVALLISQVAVPKPKNWDNSRQFEKLRKCYLDLVTVLIHRVKTDLKADEICFLQFATIKHILQFSRQNLDDEIREVKAKLSENRNKGSSEALSTDQRLFWLKKNYDNILYNVNKQIFSQLQRVEDRQLAVVRNQFLGEDYSYASKLIINPLLYTSELSALALLLNEFSMWSWNAEDSGFLDLNEKVEKLLNKRIKQHEIPPLNATDSKESVITEIHDELGGLFVLQAYLGQAEDTKGTIAESFSWFEIPENLDLLFDIQKNTEKLSKYRKEHGLKKWWSRRGDVKGLGKTLKAFSKLLRKEKVLPQLLASHYMRRSLHPTILEFVDLKIVCQFLSGNIETEKVQASITGGNQLSVEQIRSLEILRDKIREQIAKADAKDSLKLLLDFSRFRQQLKFFRFAHRAFNRIKLLSLEEDIKLSKSAGTLYMMPTSGEIEEDDAKIVHHAILKADVRGSTTVTDELQAKGLNPASYFSMRFFNPINKILETYGANKVFIEGDAIILSFLEYEHAPQQWFSVARSCGYAKDMLKITGSNNRYSTQMGLPLLELGVGICYSNEAPRFLYDGDHPIMISGAIGLADRMSGCSWNLRAAIKKSLFNVDVLQIGEGDTKKGEKGQHYLRYNVNGINIDDLAFKKLKTEIPLKSLRMKLNAKDYLFHVGQYPDMNGRKKDLVIREGKVGLWLDNEIHDDPDSDESYYEVVVNRKVLPLVLEAAGKNQVEVVN
ncbi:MAG: hypothetical protein GKR91_15765 [Pseudomonadales bacterium]|nr:hypothetical protein [Pseudomonadales bacterium]